MFCFVFLAPYARPNRYEEAFFSLEKQVEKGSLRSRASLLIVSVAVDIRLIVDIRRCQLYFRYDAVPEGVCSSDRY